MRVFLIKPRSGVSAEGEYDKKTGSLIVKKGAKVSKDVRDYSNKPATVTLEQRKDLIVNDELIKDVVFKSPSGAAVFVSGRSTNGLEAWKNEDGQTLNEILGKI